MTFEPFLTDKVTLVNKDGTTHENIPAGVQAKLILIADASLPIEAGDEIKRLLPSGKEETFVVTDPGFYQQFGDVPAHYQIKYKRDDAASQGHPGGVTVNVSGGDNTRVNVGSVDQSVNVSKSQVGATFDQTRELVRDGVADATERGRLLEKIDQMERAHGKDGFAQAYKDFMAVAADHVTVLGPVMAALAALL